uniref:Putative secreted protein n=1 Tax=Lutzomyia longipalpis TaxID=7200 RepID=A0A7G3AMK7_LUTLO
MITPWTFPILFLPVSPAISVFASKHRNDYFLALGDNILETFFLHTHSIHRDRQCGDDFLKRHSNSRARQRK